VSDLLLDLNEELLDVEGHMQPKTSDQASKEGDEDEEVEAHKTRPKTRP
jgi:hypothetical protein